MKGQGKVQVKYGHQMKILHRCRATHAVGVIWDVEYDGIIYFLFDPRKGQSKVKLVQISELKTLSLKHAFVVQFSLRIKKKIVSCVL